MTVRHRFVLFLIVSMFWSSSAAAQVGSGCGTNGTYGINNLTGTIETPLYCSSGTWAAAALQFGSTAAGCSSTTAGAIQYTSSTFEGCNGSSWITLGSGSSAITLGTSASATNPSSTGDVTTGLFSPATGTVAISSGGTEEMRVTSSGVGIGTASPTRELDVAASVTHSTAGLTSQIALRSPTSPSNKLNLGYDTTSNYGFIEAVNESTAWQNLALQPSGGNVGIGAVAPNGKLTIVNNVYTAPLGSSYGQYQILLYDGSSAPNSYGIGIESFYMGFNSGGGYKFYQGGNTNPFMVIGGQSSTNVGIGTAAPAEPLEIYSSGSGVLLQLAGSSGTCNHTPGSSSETVSCSSDMRLKSGVVDTPSALPWLSSIRVRDFTWRSTGQKRTGVIAQELQRTHPEMVTYDKARDQWTVEQPNPWMLVKLLQEQQAEIDDLKKQLAAKH